MNKAMQMEQMVLEMLSISAMPLDGKKPIVKEWEQKDAKVLREQIKKGQNFGIRTGKVSNCIVVDVDTKDRGLETWTALEKKMGHIETYRVTTGSGGLHLYFDYTAGLKNGAKLVKVAGEKVGIDLKTDRGQVVGALSIHPDTLKMYQAEVPLREWAKGRDNTTLFAPLPDWLRSLLVGDAELDVNYDTHAVQKKEDAPAAEVNVDEVITLDFVTNIVMKCINKKRADDYDDWRNIVFALRHAGDQYKLKLQDLAHSFSKQSDTYLKKDGASAVNDLWKAKDAKDKPVTLGTIRHFAKKDNAELYAELCRAVAVDGEAPPTNWMDLPLFLAKVPTMTAFMKFMRGCIYEIHGQTSQFFARMDEGKIVAIAQPFEGRGNDRDIELASGKTTAKTVFATLRSKACWLEKNTYKKVDFMPSFRERIEVPRVLNLFTSFPVKPIEGSSPDLEKVMWHLEHILCAKDAKFFAMFKYWLATFVQNPGQKLEIMPMFLGEQGTGKSIVFDKLFPILLGDEFFAEIDDMNQLFDRFNGDQQYTLICMLNEIGTHGKDHNQTGKLKSALTRKKKTIELKGMNKYTIPDLTNFLLASNKDCPVKAEVSNRRYAGITASSEKIGDKQYFIDLDKAINKDSVGRLLHMLLNYDVSGWVKSDIPKTAAMRLMTNMGLPPAFRFMIEVASLQTDLITEDEKQLRKHTATIYSSYTRWSQQQGEAAQPQRIFTADLLKLKLKHGPIKIEGERLQGVLAPLEDLRQSIRTAVRDLDMQFEQNDIDLE